MSELLKACPICNGSALPKFLDVKDHSVSKETFKLVKCASCGFIFTNPRPAANEIGKYYQSEEYISHTNSSKGIQNKLYQIARRNAIGGKLKLINSLKASSKQLLDFGSGTGEFLAAAKENGWSVRGMEPDPGARELSIQNHHVEVTSPEQLKELPDASLDVITLWHVLEHVHALQETVEHFQRVLKPGGCLVIAVPNADSNDAKVYGSAWAAYDVPRHLYHFTLPVMERLMKDKGFRMQSVKGMFFDPFYISLLSEKYKYQGVNPLRVAWNGLITNVKGIGNVKEHSSLLFIFCK